MRGRKMVLERRASSLEHWKLEVKLHFSGLQYPLRDARYDQLPSDPWGYFCSVLSWVHCTD